MRKRRQLPRAPRIQTGPRGRADAELIRCARRLEALRAKRRRELADARKRLKAIDDEIKTAAKELRALANAISTQPDSPPSRLFGEKQTDR